MTPAESGFMWIVPGQIGACAYPMSEDDWAALRDQRVEVLINLHTRAHPRTTLQARALEQVHIPVPDLTPPGPPQIEAGLQALDDALGRGRRVAVHCGAGMGRTGTLLACYFVRAGASADQAIARIRALRPGSIETAEQEQAVRAYARRVGRHAS